jgi:hypothetical protein
MRLGHSAPEEFLRGSKGVCLKPGRTQQPFQGASEARIVLDNSDGVFACGDVWVHYPPLSQTCRSLSIVLMGKFRSLGEAERPPYTFSASRILPSLHVGRGSGLEDLAEPLDRTPQLGRRLHSHFVHYLGAMRFDRALAGADQT